jgi:excisionase family DNA binding protein
VSDFLTDRELADLLEIPQRTPGQWRYLGKGPRYVRVGRHVRYRRTDVEAWIEARMIGPRGAA